MKIQISLASLRGYCAGVDRAIKILDKVLKNYTAPIYVNHEIIHNKFIINYYKKKGVIFGEDLNNIAEKSIIIFSAHGVGPEFIKRVKEKKLKYIDASCPLVVKVHIKAKGFLDKGYEIIYIGKKGHQEAEAVKEEGKDKIHIIGNKNDLKQLSIENSSHLALLTQTTLSTIETKNLIEKIKDKFPKIVLQKDEDICYATTNRQNAVLKICKDNIDLLLIIGSKNSSNSNKLKEIGEKLNIKSLLIDSSKEIDINVLEKIAEEKEIIRIGISSGASAPEHLVQEVLSFFKNIGKTEIKEIKTVEEKMIFSSNFDIK